MFKGACNPVLSGCCGPRVILRLPLVQLTGTTSYSLSHIMQWLTTVLNDICSRYSIISKLKTEGLKFRVKVRQSVCLSVSVCVWQVKVCPLFGTTICHHHHYHYHHHQGRSHSCSLFLCYSLWLILGRPKFILYVNSGFHREVAEHCALLGSYAASSGHFLPTDLLVVPKRR